MIQYETLNEKRKHQDSVHVRYVAELSKFWASFSLHSISQLAPRHLLYSAAVTALAVPSLVPDIESCTHDIATHCRYSICCGWQPSLSHPSPPNRSAQHVPDFHWPLADRPRQRLWWGGRIGRLCRACPRWLYRERRRDLPCPWLWDECKLARCSLYWRRKTPNNEMPWRCIPFPLDHFFFCFLPAEAAAGA